jgi:F0F1-type ATP synthase membrane subunit c/vacuolar-type H+-ATPase subunit K
MGSLSALAIGTAEERDQASGLMARQAEILTQFLILFLLADAIQ